MINRFVKGCTYSHSTALDLNILVLSIVSVNPERVKLKIKYINKHNGRVQYTGKGQCGHIDTVKVLTHDLQSWSIIKHSSAI